MLKESSQTLSQPLEMCVIWWCKWTLIIVWCVVWLFSKKTLIAKGHCATSSQYNFILGTKHSSHVSLHYTLENLTTLLLFLFFLIFLRRSFRWCQKLISESLQNTKGPSERSVHVFAKAKTTPFKDNQRKYFIPLN